MTTRTEVWHGCYEGSWKGLITNESFAHPAKMARGLLCRILDRMLSEGWLKPGDLVGDPFGGIGTTGIEGASRGLRVVCVELEPRFVAFAEQNFALHRHTWETMGDPHPQIVQGDSRGFAEIVGRCAGIVTSPPYAESFSGAESEPADKVQERMRKAGHSEHVVKKATGHTGGLGYGGTPGQIASLPSGELGAVITSPPYAESVHDQSAKGQTVDTSKCSKPAGPNSQARLGGYGSETGQIGKLPAGQVDAILTSPPYAESVKGDHAETETAAETTAKRKTAGGSLGQSQRNGGYGVSDGQVGALAEGQLQAVVTSPPYAKSMDTVEDTEARKARAAGFECGQKELRYGQNPNTFLSKDPSGLSNDDRQAIADSNPQIGQLREETYWHAMRTIYDQCRLALKPGGYLVVVIKSYVKDGQIVDLPSQTVQLLEHLGFDVFLRVQAMLVKETDDAGLFGRQRTKKERKSFFRRLAEKKGSPRIDFEEVLFARAPS